MSTSHLMQTYSPLPVAFARGEGCWLWDTQGRKYLDALAGIAVNGLGHNHPVLVRALCDQAARLIHTSNLFHVPEQERAAEKVCAIAGMDNAFFCNSGAEANEAAIKLARLHGHQRGIENPSIIVMEKAWHGRTLATLSATGSRKAQAGFEPLMGGFLRVPYNDFAAIERLADNASVVAVLMEVLQGEGGIHVADGAYLRKVRELCDKRKWLLMIDEVQSGIGRTGKWFAHQWAGIVPDVMPLAKGLGSGVPIGACLARGEAAKVFKPGNHGTTFGGGPLVSVAAITTLEVIEKDGLLANAAKMGDIVKGGLARELSGVAGVKEIRGMGLMLGIELDRPCGDIVRRALDAGLVANVTADKVIRLLPPLVIREEEARAIVSILAPLVKAFLAESPGRSRRRVKHFLQLRDLEREELEHLFARSKVIKERFKNYVAYQPLADRMLAMVFEKSSTRTRVSFEAGIHQLGGSSIVLNTSETQLGRGEPIEDVARVISRMVDIVMIRTFEHAIIERFASQSRVPVINGLTNDYHPCQVLADIYTYLEHRGTISGTTVAWIGDGNNMCNTWIQAAHVFGFRLNICTPSGYGVEAERLAVSGPGRVEIYADPAKACEGANLVNTDVWTSMGFEAEAGAREQAFRGFTVDAPMMSHAKPDALFMHCLPAHRGEEVSAEVLEGPSSVVWEQAENRLHAQKALMEYLLLGRIDT